MFYGQSFISMLNVRARVVQELIFMTWVVELHYCSWFQIGKAKVLKKTENDKVLVIGAGVTLHEAITAATELAKASINVRVLDPFTVKPIDSETIVANAKECGGRILTVEDHYPQGNAWTFSRR